VKKLSGKISDRIRRGEIDADPLAERAPVDDRPQPETLRHGSGHGLGKGGLRDGSGRVEEIG
jgi:hypothetical protein